MLATHLPAEYTRCLEFCHQHSLPLEQIENSAIGVDHAVLGAHLLNDWNIPNHILDAVGFHHRPKQATSGGLSLAAAIELADMLAHEWELGDSGNPGHKRLTESAARQDTRSPLAEEPVWQEMLRTIAISALERLRQMDDNEKNPPSLRPKHVRNQSSADPNPTPAAKITFWQKIIAWIGLRGAGGE